MDREQLQILASGSGSVFWKTLKDILVNLRLQAADQILYTPPEEYAKIAELQQTARAVDQIVNLVENSRAELAELEANT